MSLIQKMYFIAAWVVAGSAFLAMILLAVFARGAALVAVSTIFNGLFVGTAGCFTLLYFSGWFKNGMVLFILAWVVAGVALISMIMAMSAGGGGLYTVGQFFWHIGLGTFCTLLLLNLSGRLAQVKESAPAKAKHKVASPEAT